MSELIPYILFGISGVFVMNGVALQTIANLNKGLGVRSTKGLLAIIFKFSGFALLAYVIFVYKTDRLLVGMMIFISTSVVTILLYLLARRSSIR